MQKIVGVCLAAGSSERFGQQDKIFADVGGRPLGSLVVKTALQSHLDKIIIVTIEPSVGKWRAISKELDIITVPQNGVQSTSLKTGIKCAEVLGADGVLVFLADQPMVTVHDFQRLIHFQGNDSCDFVGYQYEQIVTPPVLIASRLFSILQKLSGDVGARKMLSRLANKDSYLSPKNSNLLFDIDTKEDYRRLLHMLDVLTS